MKRSVKKSRFLLSLSLIVLLLPLALAAKNYTNSQHGFRVDFPTSWEVQENAYGTIVMALSPLTPGDTFRENVNVVSETIPDTYTLDQYFQASISNMSSSLKDFSSAGSGFMKILGQDAKWVIFTHNVGAVQAKAIQYYLLKNGKAFIVTCTATPATFQTFSMDFEKIAQSFVIQ